MVYEISVQRRAEDDLQDIFYWIAEHDSIAHAEHVLKKITDAILSIARFPARGSRPPELPVGFYTEYRQMFFKPYRIIYRIREHEIVIVLIADGRRNLKGLLTQRLTQA